jgi:hypothetical protein
MEVSKRTLGILAALAIGLSSLLVALRMKPALKPWIEPASAERSALRALSDSVSRLTSLVETARVRQVAESVLRRYPAGRAPRVISVGAGAVALASQADSLLAGLYLDAGAPVAVHVVLVDSRTLDPEPSGWVRTFTLLPPSPGGVDCAVVRVVSPYDAEHPEPWDWQWALPWGGVAGPCWFLATFGPPGPSVREWLDARYWDVAGATPAQSDSFAPRAEDDAEAGAFSRAFGWAGWSFRGVSLGGSLLLHGCVRDRPELCEAAFLRPLSAGVLPKGVGSSGQSSLYRRSSSDWSTDLPWRASRTLLAMMVKDLGPTRFAAFWRGDAPVPDAFQAAAGRSLGEWYREQLRTELRRAGVPDPAEATSWPAAIGFLVLALGASAWHAERRQVR